MKKFLALIVLILSGQILPQSSAIIVTVDGLDFANTILNTNIVNNPNYLQNAINKMNLGVQNLEIISFEWDGDAKKTDLRLKELRQLMRKYYEIAQKQNKKFIVVSHSWGTFLSYMVLAEESQATNPMKCDLYITLSSPIGSYFAEKKIDYSSTSLWTGIKSSASHQMIVGFVNQWFNGLKYKDCYNCYPIVKKWLNVWAWGDLISGPLSDFINGVEDYSVDESSVSYGVNKRNKSTTEFWHSFTTLSPNGNNQDLIEKIKYEICTVVNCTSSDNGRITLGFILDSSGSMKENDPRDMRKSAMKVIIDQLQGTENIFIVDFDNNASWINPYNWQSIDKQNLKSAINSINSDGGTNVGAGLDELRQAFESSNVSGRTGVLLLSDGLGDYSNQAEWYRQRNIPVYTISFIGEDNSKLLSDIASLTSGNYLKANSDNEIITAFNQFLNYLSGNAILTVYKSNISQGEKLVSSFFTEAYLRYLFVTLVWRGSTIDLKLHSPDGKIFNSQSSGSEWKVGDNYIFVKINHPAVGKWTADLFGSQIPAGGEDFNFQVSGDSPLKIELSEKKMIGNQMQFSLQNSGNGNISNIKPKIEVTTPKDRKEDISNSFSNNGFSYRSRDGQGNYNFEISLTGKDDGGSTVQRYFARTILVGEGTPSNIAPVKMMEGNYIYADLGEDIGNFSGLECTIYSQNGNTPIANGYVTFVNEKECTIEIQSFISDQIVNVGDIVELNVTQWQQDF
jgi:hypothetical protein